LEVTRRFLLLAAPAAACAAAAQPVLAPCVASAEAGSSLRLVFRAPSAPAPRPARIVLLLKARGKAPESIRLNGRPARVASQARGWVSVPLPPGASWQRIQVEPGAAFAGCRDPASSPYLVFEPVAPGKK
jgi:hypothetical protein